MKCLIINGSPKANGNTAKIIDEFTKNYNGEIDIINPFKNVSPCLDCGYCTMNKTCCIKDDFSKLLLDDYKIIVIASPIYMSNLPGPMLNLISRFNFLYNNKVGLNYEHFFNAKRAVLFLVGGGSASKMLKGQFNESNPIAQSKYIFKKLNATLEEKDVVLCLNTDEMRVENNSMILNKISNIAKSCSEM